MATIGLSKPFVAAYAENGGTVTYSSGGVVGKLISLKMDLEGGDTNILYADNGAAESAASFGGGTLTINTDDLSAEVMTKVLGLTKETITGVEGLTTEGAGWYKFGDDQTVPYVGFAGIVKKMVSGSAKYVVLVYPKVQFQNFNDAVNTQGETIEWQTPELTATLMRDDTANHNWRWMSTPLATEAEAVALIKNVFNITA